MKKKTESGGEGKHAGGKAPVVKGARIIPSRTWGQGARALWRSLSFRERSLIVMGIFVPALDQISRLGSLGVTMKAVGMGIREPLDFDMRLWLGLIILGATGITVFIQMFSSRVKKALKAQITRMVRRVYGGMVAEAARLPSEESGAEVEALLEEERNFTNSATSGISAILEFFASIFLVLVLLVILTWFNWVVGTIILGAGFVALIVLKFRVKSSPTKESDNLVEARKLLTKQLETIAGSRKHPRVLIEGYADNEFDRLTFADIEAKSSLARKISSVMNFGSAILMAIVFFLVSAEGAFDENKVVWMVVFIFGLRMVVSHGKTAMVKWGGILGEKKTLMTVARASLNSSLNQDHDHFDDDSSEDQNVGPVLKEGPGPRIVDYSFSGLDGGELVSRAALVVEMAVETEEEIEEFYWSFAITRLDGPPYLISKTSEDCGVNWNLPSGRSRFRMVTGPIWLPSGNYQIMFGIAQRNLLLDRVGSETSPITLSVLPDETAKRSVQKRIAPDVVAVDVEWQLEFFHENLDSGATPVDSHPIL